MSLNYPFIVELARRHSPPPGRLLDFGCGRADVAALALEAGYDAYGVDTFLGVGDSSDNLGIAADKIGKRAFTIQPDGPMPFGEGFFDVVVANQVLEHVSDLEGVRDELARVTRHGGLLLALMPTAEILWEDHLKMPLVHRLPAGSGRQRQMIRAFRRLGFGTLQHAPDEEWVSSAVSTLQQSVFHRPVSEYISTFSKSFRLIDEEEPAWAHYRIRHHWLLKRSSFLFDRRGLDRPIRQAVRRTAGAVMVLQRMSAA
jgi:SAM-dependent methyltransferase